MTKEEAIKWCHAWLEHCSWQKEKTKKLQDLAKKRKSGLVSDQEARKIMADIDRSPLVFDGANLEASIKVLLPYIGRLEDDLRLYKIREKED